MQNWKAPLTSRVCARSWKTGLHRDILDKPREIAVKEFRLAMGRDGHTDYFLRIDIFGSPLVGMFGSTRRLTGEKILQCLTSADGSLTLFSCYIVKSKASHQLKSLKAAQRITNTFRSSLGNPSVDEVF
ncbi:hypothetical protein TNIN_492461 [Trichonephila inaurata madagascariensis]|uniref:Uncharacterized protein n=1 Tax=Trichonephila inaurata madagascariensis TaxID=2747483 RepID=A0A8X6XSF7_9ARAC|nr:hypothetical protein TNIN_492461 [Trichonephila inaurata madagascariensis]